MTTTHFTAWLVNDASCLDQPYMDLTILEDELLGEDPANHAAWTTDGSKPIAFYSRTTVDARDGDIDQGIAEAEAAMEASGWRTVGSWDVVDNAYIVPVERV
ncbi:hypothetical protein [Streptomyces lavendofoliae]|uniref:Uncharacterized protein n=1 Tax=Streptomyces lavendofoliae TaxID=67314 RepID=A0A918I335_9ACTN|nr:hypothetical protein [Streptomyces lavendofoliae]GGU62264.1 hypothetical protein GCM10010274_58800 [Streptomyces lavendofoliae]